MKVLALKKSLQWTVGVTKACCYFIAPSSVVQCSKMGGCLSSLSQIIDRDGAAGNNPEAQMLYLISFFDPPKLFQVRKIPGEARIPHLEQLIWNAAEVVV